MADDKKKKNFLDNIGEAVATFGKKDSKSNTDKSLTFSDREIKAAEKRAVTTPAEERAARARSDQGQPGAFENRPKPLGFAELQSNKERTQTVVAAARSLPFGYKDWRAKEEEKHRKESAAYKLEEGAKQSLSFAKNEAGQVQKSVGKVAQGITSYKVNPLNPIDLTKGVGGKLVSEYGPLEWQMKKTREGYVPTEAGAKRLAMEQRGNEVAEIRRKEKEAQLATKEKENTLRYKQALTRQSDAEARSINSARDSQARATLLTAQAKTNLSQGRSRSSRYSGPPQSLGSTGFSSAFVRDSLRSGDPRSFEKLSMGYPESTASKLSLPQGLGQSTMQKLTMSPPTQTMNQINNAPRPTWGSAGSFAMRPTQPTQSIQQQPVQQFVQAPVQPPTQQLSFQQAPQQPAPVQITQRPAWGSPASFLKPSQQQQMAGGSWGSMASFLSPAQRARMMAAQPPVQQPVQVQPQPVPQVQVVPQPQEQPQPERPMPTAEEVVQTYKSQVGRGRPSNTPKATGPDFVP